MQLMYNSLGIFVLLVSSFIDISISETRIVCYYTNWSVYRPGTAKFNPQNINPYLCTHLIYAFGGFTKDNQLKPFDKYQDIEQGGYAKFTGLKTYNKELKTMLAIGGWNEGSTRFSPLVASADRRAQLVKNTIKFLRQNKFDGLDLDWEYPAFRDGGKAKDRENYAKLVQELREEFDREHTKTGRPRLLLTMAVPAGLEYIDKGYDVPKLNKYLDWFNLLSYDYHSAYEPAVNHHAPLYPIEEENEYSFDNDLNINATINYYLKSGADRDKLVLGIPTYGRSYTLFNPDSNEIGAPADGPGEQGDATREKGYLAYFEICQSIREEESDWTVVQPNPDALGPYAYNENQWVGYDDEDIVRRKSEFVVEQKLGGIMFWSIDNDDFRGLCGGKPYPLIEAAKESYLDGLENGVQRKTKFDANKRKQQTTTTRKPDSKKSGKTTTPAPPTTPSSGSDFKCEEEGFFEHPSDCAKYFWCLEAPGLGIVAHHFSCPSGLVFNKAADSCDYARNVYCTNKAPKTTTTTEAPIVWTTTTRTTTTEKVNYNKVSSIYKNPSRTTTIRTTTTQIPIEIDSSDLEQEDPKVIKELIELIKKAGGIEELEKQINIQEDQHANAKTDPKATTPATIINKSIVEKFKNRASLFKPRPPLFNGASQPERKTEQKAAIEKIEVEKKEEKPQFNSKKYNSINRFSRPEPQSAGIDQIPESDAVLIEKPQYTSILRRKPAKPEVIVENDYNNESDKNSEEDSGIDERSSNDSDANKKYASISRPRKPQEQVVEEDEDEDVDEEVQTSTSRTFAPTSKTTVNKYISLNRRRSTTATPNEKSEVTSETASSAQGARSSLPPRRRVQQVTTTEAKTTPKTVLDINTNQEYQIPPRNTFDITLSKNTATDIERETLIANKHIHDDDINHIALPTESVTENISQPETIPPQINENDDKVNESYNELIDGITESSDIDITTVVSDDVIDTGISEKNIDNSVNKNSYFTAPRPFTRSKTTQKTSTSPLSSSRNLISRTSVETTRASRRRPTITRTVSTEVTEDDSVPKTPRPTYSYRPGYRGTARFKASTSKSGEYKHDPAGNNYQFLEDNRLRSLNIERANKRPILEATSTESTVPIERSTRRRLTTTRTRPTTTETEEETSTEARIVENKNRFNIGPDERPDRVRFELTAGGKINFGFNSVKAKEKSAKSSDSESKIKVITGPLDKSPLVISGRELKKGHVEEIPIQTSPETVTVQNFSDKLDLSEIPLNKSDIESFVADDDLRTDGPILDETTLPVKKRLKPSKIGFKKRPDESEESTTQISNEEVSSTTERAIRRGFVPRIQQRTKSNENNDESGQFDRQSTSKIRTRTRVQASENQESEEVVRKPPLRINKSQRFETSSPRGFQSRFSGRTRSQQVSDVKPIIETESSTAKYLTRVKVSDLQYRSRQNNNIEDSENSETQDVPEESTLRTFLNYNKNEVINDQDEEINADLDVLDLITEKSIFEDQENEIDFTTIANDENEITENPLQETSIRSLPRRVQIRKRPKKIESLATRQTITEADFGKTPEFESTSSLSIKATDDDDVYETEIETASDKQIIDTTSAKPTRRLVVTRKRVNNERGSISTVSESTTEEKSPIETSTTPKTTRRRILTIRTRTGVIQSPVEVGNFETTEAPTEPSSDDKIKIDDPDVIRKRIKVYRARATTETVTETSSTHKPIVTRTRVFKRPVVKQEDQIDVSEGDESTSERSRYTTRRKLVRVTKRPVASTTEEEQVQNEDIAEESSTVGPKKGFKKVIRTKTPRVIVDRPLEQDSLVIKTDDENQQVDQIETEVEEKTEVKEENNEDENDEVSEEPSSPVIKYPTRPVGRVTIKKRPSFNQGRSSTVHPASTRFANQGGVNTRARKVTTRRFRPGSSAINTETGEIDQEKKISLGERNKKIFTKYRKTSTTTTTLPNITPHNIDIETETNEFDDVIDTTDNPQITNNNGILQTVRPRFPLNRFTSSTTSKPTTLHHVFAIDIEEDDMNKLRNAPENQADEVIKKLQKLIEINRIVEVYSKEEKLKLLKNKKLKSIKAGELTLERPPALDKFGEITREVIIKLSVKPNITASVNSTTDKPNETRSPKNIMFSETVFGTAETSTISLEGLFEREKKELELKKEETVTAVPVFRPKAIINEVEDNTTTDSPENDETTTLESRPSQFQSTKRNQLRNSPRNRTAFVTRKVTRLITDETTPLTTTTTQKIATTTFRPRTTRVVRKRVSTALNRRVSSTTEPAPITSVIPLSKSTAVPTTRATTVEPPIEISSLSNFGIDEEIASVLPALTSVKPRKTLVFNETISQDFRHEEPVVYNHIESTSAKENQENSFDKILEHQYKIKGLDKDYEDEKLEEDEKLIGVLGSQVKVILHSVSSEADKTKIECLEQGNYPHPLSCEMYISCAKMRGYLEGFIFSCGNGMSFDPISSVCDWSIKIGCTRNNVKLLTS